MKKWLFFIFLAGHSAFAQKGTYKRSDGDLLSGTWKCVKCADTTIQSIAFEDTVFRQTQLTPEGLKVTECPYRLKGEKIFVKCGDGKKWHYKIMLIDYNSLELRNYRRGNEEFKKTK